MALLGTTIRETFGAFSKKKASDALYRASSTSGQSKNISPKEAWARLLISVLLIGVAVWLLSKDSKSQTALTIIGFVTGYWLK